MARKVLEPRDHPDKDIRKALKEILAMKGGCHFSLYAGGHWGIIRCMSGCCNMSVSGTPRIPRAEAQVLVREARKCPREAGDIRNAKRSER